MRGMKAHAAYGLFLEQPRIAGLRATQAHREQVAAVIQGTLRRVQGNGSGAGSS